MRDRLIHHYFDINLDTQLRATAAADGSVGLAGPVFVEYWADGSLLTQHRAAGWRCSTLPTGTGFAPSAPTSPAMATSPPDRWTTTWPRR